MTPDEKVVRVVKVVGEILGIACTCYCLWIVFPESAKIEVRGWFSRAHNVKLPESPRQVRTEMMRDVIELQTFGIPDRWANA